MKKVTVTAEPRSDFGSARNRKLRREGWVPAVVYGRTVPAQPLRIRDKDARDLIRQGQRLVDLAAGGETRKVFIRDVQYNATGDAILHIDFNQIAMDELLTLEVPVELIGKPVGITADGGVLDVYVKHVAVRCLPDAIPEKIVADIAHLKLNDILHVGDLKAPAGVSIVAVGEVVVAAVHPPHVQEVAEAAAVPGPAEPELIKKPAAEEAPPEGAEAKPAKPAKGGEEKAEKKK